MSIECCHKESKDTYKWREYFEVSDTKSSYSEEDKGKADGDKLT